MNTLVLCSTLSILDVKSDGLDILRATSKRGILSTHKVFDWIFHQFGERAEASFGPSLVLGVGTLIV